MDLSSTQDFANQLITTVRDAPLWLSCLVLFAGAFVEYVFPPFPGDTVLIAGGFFIARGSIPFWPSAVALVAGSTFGSMAGWALGHYAHGNAKSKKLLMRVMGENNIQSIIQTYAKYGDWILILNRFLPGVRGFFMMGSGLAGVPLWRVVALGTLSGLLWNALLIGLGFFVSASLPALLTIFERYTYAVITLLVLGAVYWGHGWWRRKRKEK